MSDNGKAVVVTTSNRGVFFGNVAEDKSPVSMTLRHARNCLYWSKDVGGFLGLASKGPSTKCRIGAETESVTLYGVTSVASCSEESVLAWRGAPCV